MDSTLERIRPEGWKSAGAVEAERRGLVDANEIARQLNVPSVFIMRSAPKHEWHHVRKPEFVGRRYYYDPRRTANWLRSKSGQAALKLFQSGLVFSS